MEKPFPQSSQNCTSWEERWCALRSFTLVADSPQILHLNRHGLLYFFISKLCVTSVPLMGESVSTCDAESVISTCSGKSVISTWDDSVSTLRPVSTGNGLSGVSVVALIGCLYPLMGYVQFSSKLFSRQNTGLFKHLTSVR